MGVVGGSTPVRANARFEYAVLTFREAVSHAFAQDSGGVVNTSGRSFYKFLSHLHSALAFLYKFTYWPLCNSLYASISVRIVSWRWHHEVIFYTSG